MSVVLAITGVAANLVPFFQIVGASFGPICGAMAADYLLSGRKWAGPRQRHQLGRLRRLGARIPGGNHSIPACFGQR